MAQPYLLRSVASQNSEMTAWAELYDQEDQVNSDLADFAVFGALLAGVAVINNAPREPSSPNVASQG